MSLKIRLSGTETEVNAATEALSTVLDVLETSRPYPNRGSSRLVRVYVEAQQHRPTSTRHRQDALAEVAAEQARQDSLFGEQNHPDGTGGPVRRRQANQMRSNCQVLTSTGAVTWLAILLEEVYEALAEDNPARLRTELIQVAAVATQWVEAIDRRTAAPDLQHHQDPETIQ